MTTDGDAANTAAPVLPVSEFDVDHRLSILIHAGAKVGKTSLCSTAPLPILVLDAEGGWRFVPLRKVYWDPATGFPPAYDGTWDVCIVIVDNWETVKTVYTYLRRYTLPFTSVILDSITDIQRRCRAALRGTEDMQRSDWNVLLMQMDNVIRTYRDLNLVKELSIRCIMFVAETRLRISENKSIPSKWVPAMQGQIRDALPYIVDVCGYMYPDWELDANGQPTTSVRRIWVTANNDHYEAGERVRGRLGGSYVTMHEPPDGQVGTDVTDWMRRIFNVRPINHIVKDNNEQVPGEGNTT